MHIDLTARRLRQLLDYDQETGEFVRKVAVSNNTKAGDIAGSQDPSDGYVRIRVDLVSYKAHRLAWLWMTGEWPVGDLDHRDLNRANYAWSNLREATESQNVANSPKRRDNKSGWKGVHWSKQCGRWRADIGVKGKREYLGLYDCPAAAHFAYLSAAAKAFGEFARAA